MPDGRILHINRDGLNGGWRVETIGSGEAESFQTREEAEAHARTLARDAGDVSKVIVHDEKGGIEREWEGDAAGANPG